LGPHGESFSSPSTGGWVSNQFPHHITPSPLVGEGGVRGDEYVLHPPSPSPSHAGEGDELVGDKGALKNTFNLTPTGGTLKSMPLLSLPSTSLTSTFNPYPSTAAWIRFLGWALCLTSTIRALGSSRTSPGEIHTTGRVRHSVRRRTLSQHHGGSKAQSNSRFSISGPKNFLSSGLGGKWVALPWLGGDSD